MQGALASEIYAVLSYSVTMIRAPRSWSYSRVIKVLRKILYVEEYDHLLYCPRTML